jgi:DNA-binding MarR family transcriptional regulator
VNDGSSEGLSAQQVTPSVEVKLSQRDLADARRLLSILSGHDEDATSCRSDKAENVSGGLPVAVLHNRAREILDNRKRRYEIFGRAMFSEPAWEMLLMLYVLEGESRQSISRLGEIADISKSTALRWIDYLDAHGLVARESHPTDKRAAFVDLTGKGRSAIELYLRETLTSDD